MSSSRILEQLAIKLPKYTGRTTGVAGVAVGYMVGETFDGLEKIGGSTHQHNAWDKFKNFATGSMLFLPAYGAGFFGAKAVVKGCELAAKSGVPQAVVRMIKRL